MDVDTEQLQAELQELTRTERLLVTEVQSLQSYVGSSSGDINTTATTTTSSNSSSSMSSSRRSDPPNDPTTTSVDHPDMAAGPPVALPSNTSDPLVVLKEEILNPFASTSSTTSTSTTDTTQPLSLPPEKRTAWSDDTGTVIAARNGEERTIRSVNPFDSFREALLVADSSDERVASLSNTTDIEPQTETGSVSTATTHSVSTTASSLQTHSSSSSNRGSVTTTPAATTTTTSSSTTAPPPPRATTHDELDVESITTIDFLRVPLAATRQRSGSEGDTPVISQSSTLATGSMDDMALTTTTTGAALATPRHAGGAVNRASLGNNNNNSTVPFVPSFDPNAYSYDGDGTGTGTTDRSDIALTRTESASEFEPEPATTTTGISRHASPPLPSGTEKESVAAERTNTTPVVVAVATPPTTAAAAAAAGTAAAGTTDTTSAAVPLDQTDGLTAVASSIMSSYSLPPNCSTEDYDQDEEELALSPNDHHHLARKASSGAFSSDGDDDADEHTAAHMMKLMASRSSTANFIKPDLTLTDSQIYLTESEEALEEALVLRSPNSGDSGSSSTTSGGTPRSNQMLSPFVEASSDEGDYDHALDFFGDDNDDNEAASPRICSGEAVATAAAAVSALSPTAATPCPVADVATASHAMPEALVRRVSDQPLSSSTSTVQSRSVNDTLKPERDAPSQTAAAGSSTMLPHNDYDDPTNSSNNPKRKRDDTVSDSENVHRRDKPTMTPCERGTYLMLALLFWVGIAFLMYCLVIWSRDGVGRQEASLASPTVPTEPSPTASAVAMTDTPTMTPSTLQALSNTTVTTPPIMAVDISTAQPSVANSSITSVPSLRGSRSPTPVPVVSDDLVNEELFQLLVNVSYDQGEALRNESTPQYQAFAWLADNTNLSSYRDTKRISRYALATLYFSTGGNGTWLDDDFWLSDADECDWWSRSRVGPCDPTGRIQELELSYNNLQGTLPPELGLLTTLVSISIGGGPNNSLTGSLPLEVGELSLLQELRLPNNFLTGSMPTQLSGLLAMRTIQLNDNRLSGRLPSEVGSMTNLDVVSLQNNLLDGPLPTSIGQWSRLTTFSLASNRFSLLPTHVGLMRELLFLDLQDNQFQGSLVSELGQLQSLRVLTLARNSLTGEIVSDLGLLTNLTMLDLSNNGLTGTIPSALGMADLSSPLRSLHLNGNSLEGSIPESLVGLASLQTLDIQSNNLSGVMPNAICELYNQTLPTVYIDCNEVDCPCCDFCCEDGLGCACRHLNTTNEWLCY